MKLSREQVKDLIKGIVKEYSSNIPIDFGKKEPEDRKPKSVPMWKKLPVDTGVRQSADKPPQSVPIKTGKIGEAEQQLMLGKPIEYAVKVSSVQQHDGFQLKAEALLWDESEFDAAEINHLKTELENIVKKFIGEKNRNARKIR